MLKLGLELSKARHLVPNAIDVSLVVLGYIHPHLHNVLAPDHVLGGIESAWWRLFIIRLLTCDF